MIPVTTSLSNTFPLSLIDWSVKAPDLPDDGTTISYPFLSTQNKYYRLQFYSDFFEGDHTQAVKRQPLQMNLIQRFIVGVADLLTSGEIEASTEGTDSDEELNETIRDLMYGYIVDPIKYGYGLIWTDPNGDLTSLDPKYHDWTPSGWVYVIPLANTTNGEVDRAAVLRMVGDTFVQELRIFNVGQIGAVIPDPANIEISGVEDTLVSVPLFPLRPNTDEVGTSMLDLLGSGLVDLSQTYSDIAHARRQNAYPPVTYHANEEDIKSLVGGSAEDDELGAEFPEDLDEIQRALDQYDQHQNKWLPPEIQAVSHATYNARSADAIAYAKELVPLLAYMARLPNPFQANEAAMSGVSRKIEHAPFYNMSSSLMARIVRGIEKSSGVRVSYTHPFDIVDAVSGEDPEITSVPDPQEGLDDDVPQ